MAVACSIRVWGVVQGVGFRPFVYRLARAHALSGWVLNGEQGVEIHLEGSAQGVESFVCALQSETPPAARIAGIDMRPVQSSGFHEFTIRTSERRERPSVRISPDLPVCDECLEELFDPANPRYLYPYINCTNCGPRYSVVEALPYDRLNTTMKSWPLDDHCAAEYADPDNRRFHAQPVACAACGPGYHVASSDGKTSDTEGSIRCAVKTLCAGGILAVKGLGGYHLACDAANAGAVRALRDRKYRKEKPFALMVPDVEMARTLIELSAEAEILLTSVARPIVLAASRVEIPGIAPDNNELGLMLPYTPLHHLLFAFGAPEILVMTSANRSSEPIAYEDEDALRRLSGIADSFLIGDRPIARRVDDSVVRSGVFGPVVLRRARGYAPGVVASLPISRPILALGADLKNAITLVVNGQAFVSQHIGDLDHYQSFRAFDETIRDLVSMYEVRWDELLLVHDLHPEYTSTQHAATLGVPQVHAIQHHRAHVASVLAEREEWSKRVVGVSCDGTGYGDDGSIWGGEIFVGSIEEGFERVAHLRQAVLAGGDAAARFPVQASAGFLTQVEGLPDMFAAPFCFPDRYRSALELVHKDLRTFATTSVGRLFDAAAALLGFTREISFEGQAAMWLEQLALGFRASDAYPFPFVDAELDYRPLLRAAAEDRIRGRDIRDVARSFQRGVAQGLADAITTVCRIHAIDAVVLSGGVFQNELLTEDLKTQLLDRSLQIWTNQAVPPNDGGISLGQAVLAAFGRFDVLGKPGDRTVELSHA